MYTGVNVLLVDDEIPALENLREIVSDYMPTANIFAFDNYLEAYEVAQKNIISIAILDVEMAGKNGVELGQMLKEVNPKLNIIFATAYADYALDAARLFSSGYVLKPVTKSTLR